MARKATGRKDASRSAAPRKSTSKAAAAEPKKKAAVAKSATRKAAPARKTATKAAASKAPVRKAVAAKAPARKSTAAKAQPRKTAAKAPSRKTATAKAPARKAVVAKATPKKTAPKNATPVKAAARRKLTAPRAPAMATRKTAAARLKTAAPTQRFTVSHHNEADFKRDGLRPYAVYRDLGVAAATGGLCLAHVIRMIPPCTDEVRQRHIHAVELQLVYVIKGWMKNEFEGHGEQMMEAGSCWLQPPNIKHTVLDYSPDLEVLEIIIPADFKTKEAA